MARGFGGSTDEKQESRLLNSRADYDMQLKLLEQQKKKRVLTSRRDLRELTDEDVESQMESSPFKESSEFAYPEQTTLHTDRPAGPVLPNFRQLYGYTSDAWSRNPHTTPPFPPPALSAKSPEPPRTPRA